MPAGRPEIKIDPKKVEALAAQGLTEAQICQCLGINVDTLASRKRKYSEFVVALENGKAKGVQAVANALFEAATKSKNVQAQMYYLNNRSRGSWENTQKNNTIVTGADGGAVKIESVSRTIKK